jgi:hypothetical protein
MPVATQPSAASMKFLLNRRAAVRRRPRGCIKAACRSGRMGLGPNLAHGLVDLSTHGAGLILTTARVKGQEVDVCFVAPYGRPLQVAGQVVWTAPLGNGRFRAGLRFIKPLSYAEFVRLM